MKQQLKSTLVVIVTLMSFLIMVLQISRTGLLYQWLMVEPPPQEQLLTMTANKVPENAGESLLVSILSKQEGRSADVILGNVIQALEYAKIPYQLIQPEQLEELTPSPYQVLLVTTEQAREWPYETIWNFVQRGGRLVVMKRFHDPQWNELVGIEESRGFFLKRYMDYSLTSPFFQGISR